MISHLTRFVNLARDSRSVNDQPITEKRDSRRRAWDRPDQVPSQSRRTMEGCNVQDDLGIGFFLKGFPISYCKCRGQGYF